MEEPSVLDYLKAMINPWRGQKLEFPREEAVEDETERADLLDGISHENSPLPGTNETAQAVTANWVFKEHSGEVSARLALPWRILLAVFLAVAAQAMLEPPGRNLNSALIFYALASIILIWSFLAGEIKPASPREDSAQPMSLSVRRVPLYLSVPFIVLAFLAFGGNEFTSLNLFFWGAALVLVLAGLWEPAREGGFRGILSRGLRFIKNPDIRIKISPWFWLMLAGSVLVVFYRFHWLEGVPGEMFSDHAEKLIDVGDVLNGKTSIFFPRNTGREAFQMYLTAAVSKIFGTGLSFMSLKIGTALAGLLTLPYIYLLGKELGNRWVGLIAFVLAGIAYWPNVISRVGLRFTLYPFFTAPTLYYLLRGLHTSKRNYFILSGLALGLGLHGYSPFRFVPLVVLLGVVLYLLHKQSAGKRATIMWGLIVLVFISFLVFLPLLRYMLEDPQMFSYRAMSRMGTMERDFPGPPLGIFFSNLWKSEVMFFWDNGSIWVHSIPGRPALDMVTGGMYLLGTLLIFVRYLRRRYWTDIFLLLSIPLLMMPSILSLAFPDENPSLNRAAGALVPVFIIAAIGMQGALTGIKTGIRSKTTGTVFAVVLGLFLIAWSGMQNYNLVFSDYHEQFMKGAWNTSQMGRIIRGFSESVGDRDSAYVVPYPHWVDTRLVGIQAGYPDKDYVLWPEDFEDTLVDKSTKLFLIKPEDSDSTIALRLLYPDGVLQLVNGPYEGKDFLLFYVPSEMKTP